MSSHCGRSLIYSVAHPHCGNGKHLQPTKLLTETDLLQIKSMSTDCGITANKNIRFFRRKFIKAITLESGEWKKAKISYKQNHLMKIEEIKWFPDFCHLLSWIRLVEKFTAFKFCDRMNQAFNRNRSPSSELILKNDLALIYFENWNAWDRFFWRMSTPERNYLYNNIDHIQTMKYVLISSGSGNKLNRTSMNYWA